MLDSPSTRTRLFSPGRNFNNNGNNNANDFLSPDHHSYGKSIFSSFSFPPIFKTRRSMTFAFVFTITLFFIISTSFFVFNTLSHSQSSFWVKNIIRNRSHFSSIFSHFFPNTTNLPQFSRKANGFSRKTNFNDSSSFSDPPITTPPPPPPSPPLPPLSDRDLLNNLVDSSSEELEMLSRCNIFDGHWVKDDQLPMYGPGSCPYIDESFDCFLNGRPDNGYERYRWQPKHCKIPRYYHQHIPSINF